MTIQAIFWDYDNTILATAEAHWQKHQSVLARQGIKLHDNYRHRVYENNGQQNWQWLKEELGLVFTEKEYLQAIDLEFGQFLQNLQMRPGVEKLLNLADQKSIPQAIVTNARKASAKPVLDAKNITTRMQFILYKEDYQGRKPNPLPYLSALAKMATFLKQPLDPKRCLIIEDDPKGVESAHKAGAIVIQRKISESAQESPYANYCCYHEADFIKTVENLLNC